MVRGDDGTLVTGHPHECQARTAGHGVGHVARRRRVRAPVRPGACPSSTTTLSGRGTRRLGPRVVEQGHPRGAVHVAGWRARRLVRHSRPSHVIDALSVTSLAIRMAHPEPAEQPRLGDGGHRDPGRPGLELCRHDLGRHRRLGVRVQVDPELVAVPRHRGDVVLQGALAQERARTPQPSVTRRRLQGGEGRRRDRLPVQGATEALLLRLDRHLAQGADPGLVVHGWSLTSLTSPRRVDTL